MMLNFMFTYEFIMYIALLYSKLKNSTQTTNLQPLQNKIGNNFVVQV